MKFSHSLLSALIHIGGSFAIYTSEEPLTAGFTSKILHRPSHQTCPAGVWIKSTAGQNVLPVSVLIAFDWSQ